MPVNFDDAIPFFGDTIAAIGPEDLQEQIVELSVWIQQSSPDGAGDAAATAVITQAHGKSRAPYFLRVDGAAADKPGRWLLPVKQISKVGFRAGEATAAATALLVEDAQDENAKQRMFWWSETVQLQENPIRVQAAQNALNLLASGDINLIEEAAGVLRPGGELAEPLKP